MGGLKKILKLFFLSFLLFDMLFLGAPIDNFILQLRENNIVDILYHASKDNDVVDSIFHNFGPNIPTAKADGNTDAMMVYDTMNGTSTPKYRIWDGSAWGSEQSASDVSGTEIRWLQLKYAPTRDEAILVVLTNTGEVQAQVFNGSSWGSPSTLVTLNDANGSPDGGSIYRGFDIEYEQSSGDAIVVAADGSADPNYYVWNGSSWASGVNIDIPTTGRPYWVELASRSGSDELALITLDSNADVYGMRWTGSAWDNMGTSSTWDAAATTAARKAIDVAFENTSGDIMFLWGDSVTADDHNYRAYSGSTLGSITALANSQAGGQPYWIKLAPNPTSSSNQIMLGTLDAGDDLNTYMWDGSTWSAVHGEHSAAVENADAEMDFDIVFETHSSNPNDAWILWDDGATVSRKLWDGATSGWGSATTMGDDNAAVLLNSHPNNGVVLAAVYEDDTSSTDDIREAHLTSGSQTWSSIAQIWGGPVKRNTGMIRMAQAVQSYNSSNEGMLAYDTNTSITYPQYRRWTGSSWGSASSASAVNGELRHVVLKSAPTRDEVMMVTVGSTGEVQAQVWNGSNGSWGSPTLLNTMSNSNGDRDMQSLYRGFDIEYESSSGDAIVVTGDGTADPNYHVWDGSSWASGVNMDIPNGNRPNWIELAAPMATTTNDELAMILVDASSDVYGMRWTGSAWNNMGDSAVWDASAAIATEKDVDVAFETNTGDIMYIWGDSVSTDQYYRTYSGGSLSSATLLDNSQAGNVNNWMRLASNPNTSSNQIMYGVLDSGNDLNTFMWDGSNWSAVHGEHTAGAEGNASMAFDIAFETHSSNTNDAWLVYGDGLTVSRKLWDGSSWGSATTQGDDTDYLALNVHPNSGAFFMVAYESSAAATDDITENHMTGGTQTWGTAASIWGGPTTRTGLGLTKVAIASERYIPPTFEQSAYRFFENNDSTDVGAALASQDTAATLTSAGQAFRLRMLLHVGANNLSSSGQNFKLQFVGKGSGTCASPSGGTPSSYTDVGADTVIAYNNNTPSDGVSLTANISDPVHSGHNNVDQTYEEADNFTNSQGSIQSGQDGKWDFSLKDNGATASTAYCFRIIESDNTTINTYSVYPEINTATVAVSISLSTDGAVSFGAVALNATQDNTASGVNDIEVVSIDSGPADLDIKSMTWTQGTNTWTLGAGNGSNQVKWEFATSTTNWTTFAIADSNYEMDLNVVGSTFRNIYLRITMPTETDSYSAYNTTITITASAP